MFAFAGFSNIRGKLEVKKDFFPIINNLKRLLFPPSIEGIRKRGKSKLRCAHLPKCTDKLAAARGEGNTNTTKGGDIKIQKGNATIMKE